MSQVFVLPSSPATMAFLRLVQRLAAKYDVAPVNCYSASEDADRGVRNDAAPLTTAESEDTKALQEVSA